VLGGCILTLNGMLAEFLAPGFNVPADALVPTMLAGAAAGVHLGRRNALGCCGGNLATTTSESLKVLEDAVDTVSVPGPGQSPWKQQVNG